MSLPDSNSSESDQNAKVNGGGDDTTLFAPSFVDPSEGADGFSLGDGVGFTWPPQLPFEFGLYTLLEQVGEGGAGVVFRGADAQAQPVAIKLIRPELIASSKAVQRFQKESRLLAEVDSPFVPKLIEAGCVHGRYFMATEFVTGRSLNTLLGKMSPLSEALTLHIITDVLKALVALHSRELIHRDVKPGNIIVDLQTQGVDLTEAGDGFRIAKLTDFGLARQIEQSDSLAMTRQHAAIGTPLYMAPEQHLESRSVDTRADVYSVGVTMYEMLAGRAPLTAVDMGALAELHRSECPVPLRAIRPELSDAIESVIGKALEKSPAMRYQNAAEMLADVQLIHAGQPISIRPYPLTPQVKASAASSVREYRFSWELDASPKQLWPLVADTDRFNRELGLPAPVYTYDHAQSAPKIFADAKFNGISVRWREHPFQWICDREMSVLREFTGGPFRWVTSTVELHPLAGQRTRLVHRFQVAPRGILGWLLTPFQFRVMTKRELDRIYQTLAKIARDQVCAYACDLPYGRPPQLNKTQQQTLAHRTEHLADRLGDEMLANKFSERLMAVADAFAARIRPVPLARQLACSSVQALELCLQAVDVGLLDLTWDVICPACRLASDHVDSLARIESHGTCRACNARFEVDFTNSVELIFQVHAEIREVDRKTYCIGGPFHAPHVLAQNRLLSGQAIDIPLELPANDLEVRGPQLPAAHSIAIRDRAVATRTDVVLGQNSNGVLKLRSGLVCLGLENGSSSEMLVRVEEATGRGDAVTPGVASENGLFQQLFPQQFTAATQLVSRASVSLLAIRLAVDDESLDSLGDVPLRNAWANVQRQLLAGPLDAGVIECSFDSLLLRFPTTQGLVKTLEHFLADDMNGGEGYRISSFDCCFGVSSGQVMIGSHLNQSTTFGKTVRDAKARLRGQAAGTLVIHRSLLETLELLESYQDIKQQFTEVDSQAATQPDCLLLHRICDEAPPVS